MVGFHDELIHSFNKNESAIHKSDYFDKLKMRENAILLGDSLGDLRMADGAQHCKNILKIGFLNDKVGVNSTWRPLSDTVSAPWWKHLAPPVGYTWRLLTGSG